MSNPESTLSRIQREIRENLKREDELRNGYYKNYNGNVENGSSSLETEEQEDETGTNGTDTEENGLSEKSSEKVNGLPEKYHETNGLPEKSKENTKQNSFIRRFTPNTTRGVMQKFFKSRGKVTMTSVNNNENKNGWISDVTFEPAKVTVEKGKPLRNGYIPAEEKIVKELYDFQQREAELRQIRRQSQPDLMAALYLEEDSDCSNWENTLKDPKTLKHTKSVANLYQPDEEKVTQINSAPCSLKPARSLAALCDLSDDEIEIPSTHSLIMQFENMKV